MTKKHDNCTDFAEGLPPIHMAAPSPMPTTAPRRDEPSCLRVFFAWEFLRLFYNIPLAAIFLIGVFHVARDAREIPPASALFGCGGIYFLIVNVPFCLCHVLEVYLCWLGMRRSITRFGIFVTITSVIAGGLGALVFVK